jgi:TetR/AcrR family transcriptional regulator
MPKRRSTAKTRSKPRPKRLYARTQQTRDTILAAALHEFARSGFAGARTERIVRRAGINKQALYYHFGSKEKLFRAALASTYEQFHVDQTEWTSAHLTPVAAMEQLVGAIFDHVRSHEDGTALIAHENRLHGAHLTPELRQRVRRAVKPLIASISSILERGQAERLFRRDVDAKQLHLTIISLCMFNFTNAFTLSAIIGHNLLGKATLAARRQHIIAFVLAGLRA